MLKALNPESECNQAWLVSVRPMTLLVMLFAVILTAQSAHAQMLTILYSFKGGTDGANCESGLLQDAAGNLYGTTLSGGLYNNFQCTDYGCGTVFRLSPNGKELVYRFKGGHLDGALPVAGVIGATGTLYGTTPRGGYSDGGTIFSISRAGEVIRSFKNGVAGYQPNGGVVIDRSGNLYGTTTFGAMGPVHKSSVAEPSGNLMQRALSLISTISPATETAHGHTGR